MHITCKLGTMRKEVEWCVLPQSSDDQETIIIQSDRRIAWISPKKKKAMLSKSTSNPGYAYLSPQLGATVVDVSDEIIAMAQGNVPQPGDEIGPGVYIAAA